jgi:adenylate cyclase
MRVGLLSSSPRGAHGLAAWAGRIGATATDTNETALQKRLAVVLCAGTLPFTVLWSVVYLLVDAPLAAAAPAFYSVFTLVNTALFVWTRNLGFYRFTQLLLILILPWLVTMRWAAFGNPAWSSSGRHFVRWDRFCSKSPSGRSFGSWASSRC